MGLGLLDCCYWKWINQIRIRDSIWEHSSVTWSITDSSSVCCVHRFIGIEMTNVRFKDALFHHCYFEDIKSTDTLFENCTIVNTVFYNTGISIRYTKWTISNFISVASLIPSVSFFYRFVLCRFMEWLQVHRLQLHQCLIFSSQKRLPS